MKHFDSLAPDGQHANWARRWTKRGPLNWRIVPEAFYPEAFKSKYGISPLETRVRRLRAAQRGDCEAL